LGANAGATAPKSSTVASKPRIVVVVLIVVLLGDDPMEEIGWQRCQRFGDAEVIRSQSGRRRGDRAARVVAGAGKLAGFRYE
jgi:hypothetical protein